MAELLILDHLDKILRAPDGISRLRSLIIDLAVHGRLLSDPIEGEASKHDEILGNDEVDLPALPPGWDWTPLAGTGRLFSGSSTSAATKAALSENRSGIPYIATKDVGYGREDLNYATGLLVDRRDSSLTRARTGAVLICLEGGSAGRKMGVTNREVCIGNKLLANETSDRLDPSFLLYYYQSTRFQSEFSNRKTGIIGGVSKRAIASILIPLAPVEQQGRIVADLDNFMAICDEFESRLQMKADASTRFRASALDALVNAVGDDEVATAWTRVHDNWDALMDDKEYVDGIRQAVVELAVRGRLEPQDPGDEPADQLLARCLEERNQVKQSRKVRLPRNSVPLDQIPKRFPIPPGWTWCRFTDVGLLERGRSKHRPRNDPALYVEGAVPLIQTGDVARASGRITTYTALYNDAGVAQSRLWPEGTLCITIAAHIADSALLGFDACFPDSVVGFLPFSCIGGAKWFEFFMRTAKSHLDAFAPSTAQKNINLAILDEVLIPLPPLAEQRRIVAKVDELLHLCDELEVRLGNRKVLAESLAESVIYHLGRLMANAD